MTFEQPIGEDEILAQRRFLGRLARGLVDPALAEDVVQEAELRALVHGAGRASSRAWLVTVTRRIALNLRRAGARRERHEDEARRAPRSTPAEPPEVLVGLELQRDVLALVTALEEPYRAVVWLRYYEDLKPQAIAKRLGVPLATVKTRLRRALERLRGELDDANGGRREAWVVALAPLAARAGGVAGVGVGGMLMKNFVVAGVLGAFAFVGWRSWSGAEPVQRAQQEARPAAEPAGPSRVALATAQPPSVAPARREVVEEPPAPTVAAATARAPATLAVHVTHASDGSDAAAIGLLLWPSYSDPLAELNARSAVTDERGRARFEGVAPGAYNLRSDREKSELVELAAGEERELALVLPPGIDVAGRVVDGRGAPVADAEIWAEGEYSGIRGGRVVARSEPDGRFALRSLGEHQSLGAFASGFAPSFLVRPTTQDGKRGRDAGEVAVTLVLDRAGSELHGRVVDPAGRPIEGARVSLGTHGNVVGSGRTENEQGWLPRARVMTTDADGRFDIGWLARSLPVHVLARGFAVARADVESTTPAELIVQMEVGATIEGVLCDEDGSRLAGAVIEVERAGLVRSSGTSFLSPTSTGADGTYRLAHVPSGEVCLRVIVEGRDRLEESRFVADGANERWDIVVGESRGESAEDPSPR